MSGGEDRLAQRDVTRTYLKITGSCRSAIKGR
jgi:hypothetical protein